MKLFAEIAKAEENDDGTLTVAGYASSEVVDAAGEVIKANAIKDALPDFFKYGSGPLREMHQNIAAGAVQKAEVQGDGRTYIEAIVVDPVSVKKVQSGVLKGFSVGGKCLARDEVEKNVITKMRLTEISLVDRPCNPEAVISMYKAEDMSDENQTTDQSVTEPEQFLTKANLVALLQDPEIRDILKREFSDKQREDMAEEGTAMPDGSFPIASKKDLENAISSYGRAKDPEAAKKHIIERAKALKATDMLPADWPGSTKEEDDKEKAEKVSELRKSIRALGVKSGSEDIAKGMYQVADFAYLIQQLAWLQSCCEEEAEMEGDDSPLPGQILDAIKTLGGLLVAMAQEEVAELAGGDDNEAMAMLGGAIELCASNAGLQKFAPLIDIAKAGARNSAADQAKLQAAHDILVELGTDCKMAGAPTDDPEMEVIRSEGTDLHKHEHDDGKIAKALGQVEKLAGEVGTLRKALTDSQAEVETLKKTIADMPQPPKGNLMAIGKAEEVSPLGDPAEIKPVLKNDGSVDEVATELKKVFAGGGTRIR